MAADLPRNVSEFWEDALAAKAQNNKESAMKNFLGYYDLLNIFLQSINVRFPKPMLKKKIAEVEAEIRVLLQDQDYISTTSLPKEGITAISAAVGLTPEEGPRVVGRTDLLSAPIYVKISHIRSLEVEQLALVDYRRKSDPETSLLKLAVTCEGRTEEFLYEEETNPQIALSAVAKEILESKGVEFIMNSEGETETLIQTNYPSIQNLLEAYLVLGG